MRLLITGGYGCIGSWVAHLLARSGQQVWIYDLKQDRHRLDLLLEPGEEERIHYIAGDVADADSLRRAAEEMEATHLLHLAGLQVPTCRANPLLGATVNVLGTLAVFEAARVLAPRIERVVYASSAAVHGPPREGEGRRGDQVRLDPVTHYGAFKVCNELNARVYWMEHQITSVGLRPWTVYGVGRDFGVTSEPTKAIKAVAVGRPFPISYGGLQDFQYAEDVAAAFLRVLSAPFQGAEAYNVRGVVVPMSTFLETLERVVPGAAGLVSHAQRQLPIAPDLDDARLQEHFGPLPCMPLEDGVRETFDRFRRLRDLGRLDLSDL